MSTIVRNNAKGLAVVLSAAMVLSATAFPTSDAKAKKPKLSKTKVSVEVGKKVKVTVKNAKKVTWTLPKAAKKIVALKKKSKKGATIVGKAVGKAKIKVTMKGKKKVKKTLTVTVTEAKTTTNKGNTGSATPTPNSGQQQATPTPTQQATPTPTATATPNLLPEVPPEYKDTEFEVDLSTAVDETGEPIAYSADTGLVINDMPIFRVNLPETVPMESEFKVFVTGELNGENGFRCYPVMDNQDISQASEIANSDNDGIEAGAGAFQWDFDVANDVGDCNQLQFKGIQHGTNIDGLVIKKIVIAYKKAAETEETQ